MSVKTKIKEYKTALMYYTYRVHPLQPHKIVFCNYNGKGYGCNPKYIAEELIRRHPDWDYVWLAKDINTKLPKNVRAVEYDSKESIYELATAGVWIDNQRKLWFHRKRKKQFFIETWHGAGIPIKKIGADNPANFKNKPYEHTSKHMNKIADCMISGSTSCSEIFHRAFLYTKEIINCGYPRNDIFFADVEKYRLKIRDYFGIEYNTKIAIYSPTYRKGRGVEKYTIDYSKLKESFEKRFGGEWVIMLRLHPTMREKAGTIICGDAIDASLYEDMQELMAGADAMISDYSSVITEIALLKKPVFLYANDISEYSDERDFYCDYRALPFPLSENLEELYLSIENFKEDVYLTGLDECFKQYGIIEQGTASKSVADMIDKRVELL